MGALTRTPSIVALEKAALAADAADHLPDNDDLRASCEKLDKVVETSIEFSHAFEKALKNHSQQELKDHLVTVLPKGHKIPSHF